MLGTDLWALPLKAYCTPSVLLQQFEGSLKQLKIGIGTAIVSPQALESTRIVTTADGAGIAVTALMVDVVSLTRLNRAKSVLIRQHVLPT